MRVWMIKYVWPLSLGVLFFGGVSCAGVLADKPVYSEDFNGSKVQIGRERHDGFKKYSKVSPGCGTQASGCLRHHYEPNKTGSKPQVRHQRIPKGLAYTLQYDIRFDPEFEFSRGGKLHGLVPDSPTTGCRPQRKDGWSARVMWRQQGVAELYIYDQTRKQNDKSCGWSYSTGKPVFKKGVYQAVSLYVKLNTVGKADGVAELWIDGEKQAEKQGIEYRGVAEHTEISKVAYSTFFGGHDTRWSPSKSVYASLDNVMVRSGRQIRLAPLGVAATAAIPR